MTSVNGIGPTGAITTRPWFLVAAVVVVGLNLRSPITAVSAVLPDIRSELGLSPVVAGLLTSLPVLCFAGVSPLVVLFARRLGTDRAILISLLVIGAAVALRPWAGAWTLLAGTAVAGVAITVGNVLTPVVVRRDFPARPGPVLSLSTAALTGGAALAAALTAPLALVIGWRAATASWAALSVVGAAAWWLATRSHQAGAPPAASPHGAVWRHPDAWWLGVYFGMQAGLYYAVTAWLPTLLADLGRTAADAGAALFQLLGILGTLIVPVLVAKLRARRLLAALIAVTWVVFLGGLLVAPSMFVLWCVIGGLGQGGGIAIALTLVVLRAADVGAARHLSAMVQTIGYTIGAVFPVLIGGAFGATGGWAVPTLMLIGAAALMVASAAFAAASRPIGLD
ncbi:MAG TPA: MFS transporter [Jiangellaceae bacterium]|nr:MFS transporter [Jiangellaceae bacterium]